MKRLVVVLIAVLVLALAMAVTCPDEASFHRHMEQRARSGGVLDKAKGAALAAQARMTADLADRFLFATVEVRQGTRLESYLGVFGIWFQLSDGR